MPEKLSVLISGQGLAGTILAFKLLERDISFTIFDSGLGGSSRVAAGLINPITGKNFEPSWLIERFYPQAIQFFQDFEKRFSVKVWHPLLIERLAMTEKEWRKIEGKLSEPRVREWLMAPAISQSADFTGAVMLQGGGWIDTRTFLDTSRAYFQELGVFISQSISLKYYGEIVRCEGAAGLMQDQLGNHRCAKGEILTVSAAWEIPTIRIGAGGWLIPIEEGRFRVGSTYEWNELNQEPTEKGRLRIDEIAQRLGGAEFKILDHAAGIRPIIRKSQPLIGKNSAGDWILNGLGSKGTLYAAGMAEMLVDWIDRGIEPEQDFVYH